MKRYRVSGKKTFKKKKYFWLNDSIFLFFFEAPCLIRTAVFILIESLTFMCVWSRMQVRIMFEVQDLKYATLATVSRCGMVWFSEDVLSTEMVFENYLQMLRCVPLEESEEDVRHSRTSGEAKEDEVSPTVQVIIFHCSASSFCKNDLVYLSYLA